MYSEMKEYSYPNGEIQRVQVVRWDDWSQLDFLRPSYSLASLECFYDIYRNFLVPACPWIFGQMVMVQVPEDMDAVWGSIKTYDDDWHKNYSGVVDTLTVITMMLKKGVHLVGGKPRFLTEEASALWRELEKRNCIRIVRGKLPHTQIIPVGNKCGYLSGAGCFAVAEDSVEANGSSHMEDSVKPDQLRVNSSFFIMDPIDCATVYDQIGAVIGLCVKDGEVLNPPMYDREALLVSQDGRVSIRNVSIRELDIEIGGKKYRHGENATIYTRPEKKKLCLRTGGIIAVIIVGNRVVDVKSKGVVEIPASGFVMCVKKELIRDISGKDIATDRPHDLSRDSDISSGDTVIYHGLEDIQFGIQVGNSVIREGVKTQGFISRFYNIYHLEPVPFPPSLYPMDYEKARTARIALGADQYGKPMLFWAEGAAKFGYVPGEGSCGASLSEMAEIASDIGMVNGVNLDGGGSAQILLNGERSLMISDRKKEDHSEAERLIPLGLVVR